MQIFNTHFICKNEDELLEGLVNGLNFDLDISGQNGPEYLQKETVEAGYENDVEYFYYRCRREYFIAFKHQDICKVIDYIIERLLDSYYYCDYDVLDIGAGAYSVVLTCVKRDD